MWVIRGNEELTCWEEEEGGGGKRKGEEVEEG